MSGTANEFDNPGANYPDRADVNAQAQTGAQDAPLLAQNRATPSEQIEGIVAQTRADLGDESTARYEEVLRQRLADAGIDLAAAEVAELAQRASGA